MPQLRSRFLWALHLVESRGVNFALRKHGSLPRKDLSNLYQTHVWRPLETGSSHRSISRTPNQSQYVLYVLSESHQFFGSSVNLLHLTLAVFKLPDELILSILSHISPDPLLANHYACFCIPYRKICNFHGQKVQFLRPLSMTCRAMRLRLVPWVWERLALSWGSSEGARVKSFNTIANASQANKFLATSVKYFQYFFASGLGLIRVP